MGMFDRLYDADGNEWQTKAYNCGLDQYRAGDSMPDPDGTCVKTYQVEILGGPYTGVDRDSFATVREGTLEAVDALRDERLPLVGYWGWTDTDHDTAIGPCPNIQHKGNCAVSPFAEGAEELAEKILRQLEKYPNLSRSASVDLVAAFISNHRAWRP